MTGVTWETAPLQKGIASFGARMEAGITALMEYNADHGEATMKSNAPWTDRTSNARNGLSARSYREGQTFGIVFFHQVPYGIYLETRWSGRFAVIMPTINIMGPDVMNQAQALMKGLQR
jgi:hypothetical protein